MRVSGARGANPVESDVADQRHDESTGPDGHHSDEPVSTQAASSGVDANAQSMHSKAWDIVRYIGQRYREFLELAFDVDGVIRQRKLVDRVVHRALVPFVIGGEWKLQHRWRNDSRIELESFEFQHSIDFFEPDHDAD